MYEEVVEGNVISFLNLLLEDAIILDRVTAGSYPETPLYIVSVLGHTQFVREILCRKPKLTSELDP
ncbi:hypothetical protein Patl1_35358 [Pistacia atlantica]|nr:hypothetical protein Patl1_35358 [Pistacia atlantica]